MSNKKTLKFLFTIIIFAILLYYFQLFIFYTHQSILHKGLTRYHYLLSIKIIIFLAVAMFSGKALSMTLFSYIYTAFGLYLGYMLYIFQVSVFIHILSLFITLPENIGIGIFFLCPLIICIYGVINALTTRVKKINLKYPGYNDKTTILLLSDIHLGALHQKGSIKRIVKETKELNPDIVVIAGDMADGSIKVKSDWMMPFNELTMPILYVTGNHEEMNPRDDMLKAVNETKIKHIGQNETYKFKGINFIGVDYGLNLRQSLSKVKQEKYVPNILISHIPILVPEELKEYNIFLFLAGHTHGGQMFPIHILAYLLNACFSGLYSDQTFSHHVYVTDGVNNAVVPMRVGSSRMFPLITIEGCN